MRDADKTAALISLLRRRVPREVAGLAADAMHPFGELGDWPPDGKARSEAKEVARAIAGRVGRYADAVPTEDLKSWIRWAFCEYARIAEQGSPAARAFAQSANRPEL